ncbi:MAG: D-inositol-3-phosphate glycosyltransferase [Anaerolineales bacterium]|nr:D-inositol-3-phosphate glycosyltransferase [Anaerolineales bacterium]
MLAGACEGGMSLFAGMARAEEGIASADLFRIPYSVPAENLHLFRGRFYLCYQRGLIRWLEKTNPDALIVEANPRYLATPFAVKWMRARGRKVIGWGLGAPWPPSSLRDTPPISERNGGRWRGVWSQFINQFDALIAYSQRGADEYTALGFPREKIFVAMNAVAPKPTSPLDFRPLIFDQPSILFVGRLQARKRVDWLLRACAEMERQPRLVIVGDGPERAALESLAREVYPAAQFAGAKHGAELNPYFAQANLFVLPGTGGLAIQEAMSHGLPVIVAKGDGTQDDLVRETNGWQIPPEEYDALVGVMREALTDMNRLRRMGDESRRIVAQEINLETMVAAFVRALEFVR